jgi:hypothetical protein
MPRPNRFREIDQKADRDRTTPSALMSCLESTAENVKKPPQLANFRGFDVFRQTWSARRGSDDPPDPANKRAYDLENAFELVVI